MLDRLKEIEAFEKDLWRLGESLCECDPDTYDEKQAILAKLEDTADEFEKENQYV